MAETIMTSQAPQEKVGTVPSGKTLQGQIDALNSKIANNKQRLSGADLLIFTTGNTVILVTSGNGVSLPITSAIIPLGQRPKNDIYVPCVTQSNTGCYWARIKTDGTIGLYQGGNPVATTVQYMIFNATWAV